MTVRGLEDTLEVFIAAKSGNFWKKLSSAVTVCLRRFSRALEQGRRRRGRGRALLTALILGLAGLVMLPAAPASAETFDTLTLPAGSDGWDVTFHPTNQNYAFFVNHRSSNFGCFYRLDPDGENVGIEQGEGCFVDSNNNRVFHLDIGGRVGQRSSAWVTSDGNTVYIPRNHEDLDPNNSSLVGDGGPSIATVDISLPDPTQWEVGTPVNFSDNMQPHSNSIMVDDVLWALSKEGILKYDTNTQTASMYSKAIWVQSNIYYADGKIWAVGSATALVCFDISSDQFCSHGNFTDGSGANFATIDVMTEYRNQDGTFGGFCSGLASSILDPHTTCINSNGFVDTDMANPIPANFDPGSFNNYGRFYVTDEHQVILHQPIDESQTYRCWDYKEQSQCTNFYALTAPTSTPGKAYTVIQDPWNTNCLWTNSDDRIIGAWDIGHTSGFAMPGGECNLTLVAQTATLTYDPQGGTGQPGNQTGNASSNVTVSTTAPTRAGYTFVKWNTAANGSGTDYAGGATYTLPNSGTDTLYAQWAPEVANRNATVVTLTYDPQGGTGQPGNQTGNAASNVTVSSTVPTRAGYTFTGWDTVANGSGTDYAGGATYTLPNSGTATLYAQWVSVATTGAETPTPVPVLPALWLLLTSVLLSALGIRRFV